METITVLSKQYFVLKDYIHLKYKTKRTGRCYYRCVLFKTGCVGRATSSAAAHDFRITQEHNHPPIVQDLAKLRLSASMAHRASSSNMSFRRIFGDEVANNIVGGRMCGGYSRARKCMQRARKTAQPQLPTTLQDFDAQLRQASPRAFIADSGHSQDGDHTKMPHLHHVEGYENFVNKMKEFQPDQEVYVYYSGTKLPTGESWCDDCVRAWPRVKPAMEKYLNPNAHFVYVEVGERHYWKDMKCPFRLDKNTHLLMLPTLAKWMGPERLEGEQCEKNELLELLFGDE